VAVYENVVTTPFLIAILIEKIKIIQGDFAVPYFLNDVCWGNHQFDGHILDGHQSIFQWGLDSHDVSIPMLGYNFCRRSHMVVRSSIWFYLFLGGLWVLFGNWAEIVLEQQEWVNCSDKGCGVVGGFRFRKNIAPENMTPWFWHTIGVPSGKLTVRELENQHFYYAAQLFLWPVIM
jgi:hypothetical protein